MTAARLRTIVLLIVVLLSKLLILLITMLLLLITMLILLITALPQDSRLLLGLLFTLLLADHLQSLRSSADSSNQFFKLDLLTILVKRHQQYRFFNNDTNSS